MNGRTTVQRWQGFQSRRRACKARLDAERVEAPPPNQVIAGSHCYTSAINACKNDVAAALAVCFLASDKYLLRFCCREHDLSCPLSRARFPQTRIACS
jgi:hypothetical protein